MEKMDYRIGQEQRINLQMMGKERNLPPFNMEILAAIAKQEHFRVQLFAATDPIKELENDKLDGVVTTLQPSYLYEKEFLFSNPYLLTGLVFVIPFHIPEEGWNERRKREVGVLKGSNLPSNFEQDTTAQLKLYEEILPIFNDLRNGKIDGAVLPFIPAYVYMHTFYKDEFKITTLPLTNDGLRLMTLNNPSGEKLIEKFNQGLEKIKEEGIYDDILENWDLIDVEKVVKSSKN